MKIKITHTSYPGSVPVGSVMTVISKETNGAVNATLDGDDFEWFISAGSFYVIDDKPKTWRDMTDAEKGALLLAKHEGMVIEWNCKKMDSDEWEEWDDCPDDCLWDGKHDGEGFAYRVKPEHVRETVTMKWTDMQHKSGLMFARGMYAITVDTVDGVPVCDSIRMDPVS